MLGSYELSTAPETPSCNINAALQMHFQRPSGGTLKVKLSSDRQRCANFNFPFVIPDVCPLAFITLALT